MNRTPFAAIVLAYSEVDDPKAPMSALSPKASLAGVPMVGWVVDALISASVRRIGVAGVKVSDELRALVTERTDRSLISCPAVADDPLETISRTMERLGPDLTLREDADVLLIPANLPQVRAAQLRSLIDAHAANGGVATAWSRDPTSGVIHSEPVVTRSDDGSVRSIIDPLSGPTLQTQVACIRASLFLPALRRSGPVDHADLIPGAVLGSLEAAGHPVSFHPGPDLRSVRTSHDRVAVESELRDRIVSRWLDRGVHISDPRQVSIDGTVELGRGVRILPGSVLEGRTVVGDDAVIGPNTHIVDAVIGADVVAQNVAVYGADIPSHSVLPPFSVHGSNNRRA